MTDGIRKARAPETTGCRLRSFGGGGAQPGHCRRVATFTRGGGESSSTFLAKPRSGNEETWATLMAKVLSEDHTIVSAAAPAAVHHPYRHRARETPPGHDSLSAENRRQAKRVSAEVLTALLRVESHLYRGGCAVGRFAWEWHRGRSSPQGLRDCGSPGWSFSIER